MNLDLSSMSDFEMCDRIQELIPRMKDESVHPTKKTSSMDQLLATFAFQDPAKECFDCLINGKICGKPMNFAGESVLLLIITT